jgi:hypothetical protein
MTVGRRFRIAWGVVVGTVTGACYYTTSVGPTPVPGANVTVTLAPVAQAQVSPQVGSDARVIEGRLLPSPPDSLALAVTHVARFDERGEAWHGERVTLPIRFVERVQQRRLSTTRTWLAMVGLAAGVLAAARIVDVDGARY